MGDSYQVQMSNDLDDGWTPMRPSRHGGTGAFLTGDHWHTSMKDARFHAEHLKEAMRWRNVRIVRKDIAGRVSVALPAV